MFLLQGQTGTQKQRKSAFSNKGGIFKSPKETFCNPFAEFFSLVHSIIEEVPRKITGGSLKIMASWEHYLKKQMLA